VAPVDLAIVVVSFNTREYLDRCLRLVAPADDADHVVVVVDNASTDGSAALVEDAYPRVRLIREPENMGFGRAANRGIEATAAPFVLVLNPDAWPADGDALTMLVTFLRERPGTGVVAPALVGEDGRAQLSSVGVPTRWWTGTPAVTSARPGRLGRLWFRASHRGRLSVVGAAMLIRRQAFDEVGGFDPAFFLFGEEVDLCLRLQRDGWAVAECPASTFVHVGGAATQRTWPTAYREQVRGHLRLLAKHASPEEAEAARRYLRVVLRIRSLTARGQQREIYRATARWLGTGSARSLLAPPDRTSPGRTAAAEGRTSGSAG
jgi:N-acetylglucosaminyl-diphospho-decaprenol L-rhamnosyltransferase